MTKFDVTVTERPSREEQRGAMACGCTCDIVGSPPEPSAHARPDPPEARRPGAENLSPLSGT